MNKITLNKFDSGMTDEDWFSLGKSDAWSGKPKVSPEQDAQAASMYDLGYSEGEITHSPIEITEAIKCLNHAKPDESAPNVCG
ncbi:hypothetical protein IQ259_23330 [Fortiea sp. LEGE XX443]|uniref:hypothetical protein n=1 Tax=Fortiea sp. LEGE XX443 TaxID=1828611 RepID=UPI0018823D34|nr:hypothetical protein [Fortiea sp. LEGE XX443]MBE9007913.1 hypothetical protein [Fortiea sp. LEGE XX443]